MKTLATRAAIIVLSTTVPISAAVAIHNANPIPLPSSSTTSFNGNAFQITNTATTVAANAVNGISDGAGASGVFGENHGTKGGFGVYGYAPGGTGTVGVGGAGGDGVYGKAGTNGVHGVSNIGQAAKFEILGSSNAHTAVVVSTVGSGSAGSFTSSSFTTTANALSSATNGSGAAIYGSSVGGDGVVGFANGSSSSVTTSVGVRGRTNSIFGTGVEGDGDASAGTGVAGIGDTAVFASGGSTGVFALAGSSGDGVQAQGYFGVRAFAAGLNSSSYFADCDTQGFVLIGQNGGGHVVSVDCAGNAIFKGSVTQFGNPKAITHGSDGRAVLAYAPRVSRPTMEDVGEAQLVGGQAYVRLDPAFAHTIDAAAGYLVFITPNGESRGLYTTQKTAAGFLVRENAGGRSAIGFDYRIVGKPYDSNAVRLPVYTPPAGHVRPPHHPWRVRRNT